MDTNWRHDQLLSFTPPAPASSLAGRYGCVSTNSCPAVACTGRSLPAPIFGDATHLTAWRGVGGSASCGPGRQPTPTHLLALIHIAIRVLARPASQPAPPADVEGIMSKTHMCMCSSQDTGPEVHPDSNPRRGECLQRSEG
eukprot:scaffold18810_cov118-Isochrysis_galbana.AAC.10